MLYTRKLKPESVVYYFAPAVIFLGIFALSILLLGRTMGFRILGVLFITYGIVTLGFYYRRTRSTMYIISALYLFSIGIALMTIQIQYAGNPEKVFPPISRFFGVWMIIFWIWLAYLMMTGKVQWRGRHVMELAALNVEASDNSYTERPFPIEKIDLTKDEILSFAAFMKKNLICMTYTDEDKVYFVPLNVPESVLLVIHPEFNVVEKTWVAFNFNGEITGHISKANYLEYRENLAFDQLCKDFGNMFVDFFEWYRKGEGVRIIDKLNEMKQGIFS